MIQAAELRDRLPSALIALAVQAALLAMLALSFEIVRQLPAEKETILTLPPLVRPAPSRVIDGRQPPPRAAAPAPSLTFPVPLFVVPPSTRQDNALLQALGRMLSDCAPQKYSGVAQPGCPPPTQTMARPDDRTITLNPPSHVEDESRWQDERARRNAPAAIPGGDPVGAALALLFNPGAFNEKRNYRAPPEKKMSAAEYQHRQIGINPTCPGSGVGSFGASVCQADIGAEYRHTLGGP